MFTNEDKRICNFIRINNILGTEELNRKQSNKHQKSSTFLLIAKYKNIQIIKLKINFFQNKSWKH
jgi:hypothetical protein